MAIVKPRSRGKSQGAKRSQSIADKSKAKSKTNTKPDKPWSVYLLRCADGTLYAGATNDLAKRLLAHGRGAVKYTRGRLPVECLWSERVGKQGAALSREAAIKRLTRRRKLALAGL